jgi:hypothetical protein
MNYSEDLIAQKSRFPYRPSGCLVAKVRKPKSKAQGPNATVDGGINSSRSIRGPDGRADAEVSKFVFA